MANVEIITFYKRRMTKLQLHFRTSPCQQLDTINKIRTTHEWEDPSAARHIPPLEVDAVVSEGAALAALRMVVAPVGDAVVEVAAIRPFDELHEHLICNVNVCCSAKNSV